MAGSSGQEPRDIPGFVERLHRVEQQLRARGLVHAAAHIHGAWPGHGGRSPATNVDSSTAASSPPSGALGVDTPDSPRPLRDPWAPRPAGSSVLGYYLNGDNGDFNERTASNVAVAPRRRASRSHETRINALNLEPSSTILDPIHLELRPRRHLGPGGKQPVPHGSFTKRDFLVDLARIDQKLARSRSVELVISRSVVALHRALDKEGRAERRTLHPGTGSAAPSK